MKRSRPKLTVGRLMILVAIAGLSGGTFIHLYRRSVRLERVAWQHEIEADICSSNSKAEHHLEMARKYRRAAHYPWRMVEDDPPEPR